MSTIDPRSAAFLAEMGITPLWQVRSGEAAADTQAPIAPAAAPVQPAPEPKPRAAFVPQSERPVATTVAALEAGEAAWSEEVQPEATPEEIAAMDWAQLRSAIANCTRCGQCKGGRKPVYGSGALQARWLVAAGASTLADEQAGVPLAGDPGKLLTNMLAAVDLARDQDVYVTNLVKCRPVGQNGAERAPTADEAAACRPFLERELALSGASMVLTLGQIAANALQGKPLQEPLAGLRGVVTTLRDINMVATLHPGELLRRGADKALAWADLCLAKAHDGRSA
ncbi:MAG: uracil-DNA glycosylase [Pseudomonadota bacterium]